MKLVLKLVFYRSVMMAVMIFLTIKHSPKLLVYIPAIVGTYIYVIVKNFPLVLPVLSDIWHHIKIFNKSTPA